MSIKQQPRRVRSSMTMGSRDVVTEVFGTEDLDAVDRAIANNGFPQGFRPYGSPKGVRRWLRSKVEAWVRAQARDAQRASA